MDPPKNKGGRPKKPRKGKPRKDDVEEKLPKSRKDRAKDAIRYSNRKRRKSGETGTEEDEWVCSADHGETAGDHHHQHPHHHPHHHHHHHHTMINKKHIRFSPFYGRECS